MGWKDYLPKFKTIRQESYGRSSGDYLIVHQTVGDLELDGPSDGEDAAKYGALPGAPSWHWTVGGAGSAYKGLEFNEAGAHCLGVNSITVGIEHDMMPGDKVPEAMYRTSAKIAAAWCHWRGVEPSRDRIIGHYEDHKIGGDSTHTDPHTPGRGGHWEWSHYMELVEQEYSGQSSAFFVLSWKHLLPKDREKRKPKPLAAMKDALTRRLKANQGKGFQIAQPDKGFGPPRSVKRTVKKLLKVLPDTKAGSVTKVKCLATGEVLRIYRV